MASAGQHERLRVLVTGAQGFVGSALVRRMAAQRPEWRLDAPALNLRHGRRGLDVTDASEVDRHIAERPPDIVVHLAAVAAVTAAVSDPRLAWNVNLGGTLNLILALQAHAPRAHLLFVSSAEVYGRSFLQPSPINETTLLQPMNPYAASKAAADLLVRQAVMAGLSASVVRPFNHTGPGQSEAFVAPSFAAQIARIESGGAEPVMRVGSLDEERDFLDVEDVVAAYLALLHARDTLPSGEVFNVASGQATRIGDMLEVMLSRARVRIDVEQDPARLRASPIPRAVGDACHIRERLGWRPLISFEDTLLQLMAFERGRVEAATSKA